MEMYKNKLAAAIKHNGKILRETKDMVHLPFGSEFSVLVKNLNSRRVKFTLHIDGTDALGGEEIIVNANSETDIKRFIRNGNMNEGNAFKFIERTKAIEDGQRGIKIDDGIVRIEFWFEQEQQEIKINNVYWEKHYYHQQPYPYSYRLGDPFRGIVGNVADIAGPYTSSAASGNSSFSATSGATYSTTTTTTTTTTTPIPINEVGITVPGSKIEQKFTPVYGFKAESQSETIILRLVGQVGEAEVIKPITVAHKPKCVTCGRLNKATSKFCTSCGTSLTLI